MATCPTLPICSTLPTQSIMATMVAGVGWFAAELGDQSAMPGRMISPR